jgi:uncharacterized protein (UPF0276 family)
VGVGLRVPHLQAIFSKDHRGGFSKDHRGGFSNDHRGGFSKGHHVDFFEIISENFMVDGGPPLHNLDRLLERYPVVMHGVSMGIASAGPLDFDYLRRVKALCRRTKTPWFSDHLCWTRSGAHQLHDLLPTPYTPEIAAFIAEKARIVQDFVEVPFALENLSTYVAFHTSTMTEWEFYAEVVQAADVSMMLDMNNIFVSSMNHGFSMLDYLDGLPLDRVRQVHVAGPSELDDGTMLDTHDHPVRDETWQLYAELCRRIPPPPTILEWDANFLSFEQTVAHANIARQHHPGSGRA